jgi:hypothetical protein
MLISEIYDEYKIMPSLQLHMYRVAAVSSCIADSMSVPIEKDALVAGCLLHDMGNIIKFTFDLFPEFLEPEGLHYWQHIKQEYIDKYGTDEHKATYTVAEEIGVDARILELIAAVGFTKAPINVKHSDFSKKIACYCDHRVGPHGVLPLEERMTSGRTRYAINKGESSDDVFNTCADAMRLIEKQIFEKSSLKPEDITDHMIREPLEQLEHFDVPGSAKPRIEL